ncbi:OmpA family protein [Nitrospira calida]
MQKPTPSQVTSGSITPAIVGPSKDMKDISIVAGVVLILAVIIGSFWIFSPPGVSTTPGVTGKPDSAQVSNALGTPAPPLPEPAPSIPAASAASDILHADIYFEVGRTGLTDEGKTLLQWQAAFLNNNPEYGVLVQGHTDQHGSASYNKTLGLKRAETVKAALLNAGVAEHRMKVVSLGEEGVLCTDTSDVCQRMNRRVHLELRKIGQEHMAASAGATNAPALDASHTVTSPGTLTDGSALLMDSLPPAAEPSTDTIPAPLPESSTVHTDSQ